MMKKAVKKFVSEKKNVLLLLESLLLSLLACLQLQFNVIRWQDVGSLDPWLFLLCLIAMVFISSHFIFKIDSIYQFLYRHRYKIGLFLFIILVLGKFHATSIGNWDQEIQPQHSYASDIILGSARQIRSDEWLVNTPLMFAQEHTSYAINSPLLRGAPSNVILLSTAPVLDIVEISRPLSAGILAFGNEYGLSIWWFGRLFCLFFTTFELLMILTKQKKAISFFGTILVVGSSVIQWFFAAYIVEILIGGQLALILFDKLFSLKKPWSKMLCSFFLGIGFLNFCLILYPAHQIPFGYIFLIIGIWLLLKHRKEADFKKNLWYLLIPIVMTIVIVGRFLLVSKDGIAAIGATVYPGDRFIRGGGLSEWQRLLQTPYTLLLPFKNSGDACTISSFLCLFPLPLFLAIYYMVSHRKDFRLKKLGEKGHFLLLGLTILALVYLAFCLFPLPGIFVKLTMLSKTTVNALCAPLGYLCVLLFCLLFDKMSFSKCSSKIGLGLVSIILAFINIKLCQNFMPTYVPFFLNVILGIVFALLYYCYLTRDTKYKKALVLLTMSLFAFSNILFVNPLTKGTKMITEKPVAKEIQTIVKEDPKAQWLTLSSFITPNYLMMQGARTINATNLYPNMELWKKIDPKRDYEDIYNRYAHIVVELTSAKTSFELVQVDLLILHLNYQDIKKLGVHYLYSQTEVNEEENGIRFEKIYEEDGSYIYHVIY